MWIYQCPSNWSFVLIKYFGQDLQPVNIDANPEGRVYKKINKLITDEVRKAQLDYAGENISEGINMGQATQCPVSSTDALCAVGSLAVSSSPIQSCVAGSIH